MKMVQFVEVCFTQLSTGVISNSVFLLIAIIIGSMSEFYYVSEDDRSVQVCFYSTETTNGTFRIMTRNEDATSESVLGAIY